MNETNFTVSFNGRFVFRTERDNNLDRSLATQIHLAKRFPASEGFAIVRHDHPTTFKSQTVDNGEPATLGERLAPGCECGAARNGDFQNCTCTD